MAILFWQTSVLIYASFVLTSNGFELKNPEAKVIISADQKSKSETYIRIADQTREAGI
ncbi:MAG: hypothetical protein AB9Q18_01780 [Candidatus Reddybacter sp.]